MPPIPDGAGVEALFVFPPADPSWSSPLRRFLRCESPAPLLLGILPNVEPASLAGGAALAPNPNCDDEFVFVFVTDGNGTVAGVPTSCFELSFSTFFLLDVDPDDGEAL